LGKGLIIEGVETKEEVDTLIKHGCGMFQGYYFSKPLSVEKFEDKFLQDVN
jgi:EAL domain-containing protein (putative c-di-GMP-specific phosphodiesterase class I)